MKTGKAGLDLLKSFEKCHLTAYRATPAERHYTTGWGHYGPDVKAGDVWTQERADAQLEADLARAEHVVLSCVTAPLTPNQFDALVCLCYNIGSGNFADSTLVKYLNMHKYKLADSEFLRWNKQSGKVLLGLVRRREAERALFLAP